ncbi:LysM peptidoglycan-binding domain-containing protein [Azospirillum isscasi]|uniref:LysM peptidoglycan-binding domain-containing protein n=1 Tax=Azospirillum isscasi TaxID=3053926 RepID=A0ABU0WNJ6_9PROT|nr:LysM peptidoglycan-binding domain-containing protein [Azospirillum isscasi]MDQ2105816.1 LysM peptidoglycan-binding domain-containing protein [Azospirillum isscasi]
MTSNVIGRALLAALAVLPLLAACQQRTGELAPVTSVSSTPDSIGGAVIVQRGDSAYSLSRRYNVPLRDLLEVNHLSPPYRLEVGQRLVLPVSRQYIVQRGDTLYGISRMFNADVSELTRLNGLSAPYAVQAGQPLRLPGGPGGGEAPGGTAVAQAPSSAAGASPGGVVATAPVKQVSRGSTFEYQSDERAGVARLRWRVSGR